MDELSRKFNNMLMSEVGFDIDKTGHIVDQDTGEKVQFSERNLVAYGTGMHYPKGSVEEFDPYNSSKMMSQTFSYYMEKLQESGEVPHYSIMYNVDDGDSKARFEIKNEDSKLVSKGYLRDQCRYADIILQLNGEPEPDLSEFDIPKAVQIANQKKEIKKKYDKKKKEFRKKAK